MMPRFRFAHAADLHIGSPFSGLAAKNETVAERLGSATYEAFDNLVRLCVAEKVDFLVVAGDVYDGADRSPQAQIRFRNQLSELAIQGIQSFVVHGNHDPLDGRYLNITFPEGVHVFGEEPTTVLVEREGEPLCRVQGVSYPTRVVNENLALRFNKPANDGVFDVGVLHANVGGMEGHDNYAPCTEGDLESVGLDYWALGHIHKRQTLRQSGPAIVYPGNTQGRHPNEAGDHGCVIVDVDERGEPTIQFHSLDVVRWEIADVSVEGAETLDAVYDKLAGRVQSLADDSEGRDVVCRIELTGRTDLFSELAKQDVIDGLAEELRQEWTSARPWVWVERITSKCKPVVDISRRSEQDDFLGSVLRRSEDMDSETVRGLLAEVYSGRRGRLATPNDDELAEWVEAARWKLFERFEL